jgi:Neuraminidase (sialidase)
LQTLSTTTVAGSRTILLAHQLLYSAGDYGSANYRIPAIVTAADGSLVTAADKRINGSADLPANIDIIVRRSTDNGQTWAAPVVIADLGAAGASDPALVVDKTTGKIICLFATNNGVFASTPANPIRIQYCSSMDNGITWSALTDITSQIYGPTGWYAAWVASGRAHQLRNGRIVAAVGVRQTAGTQLDNFMIYSDDGGITWSPSTGIAEANGDEAKIVELNNGQIMMSIRNPGTRRMNISANQGASWGTAYNQTDITDPNCDGDFIRYTSTLDGYDKNRLVHTIPFAGTRRNVSVLVSYDEGTSWTVNKTIYPGASAYSSITI